MEKVLKIIDKKIKPYLNSHGGDINIIKKENDILYVKILGACAGCLSLDETLESVIKDNLIGVDNIKDVVVDNFVSKELINEALKILKKERG